MDRDYTIFKYALINEVDKVFAKVRNLTYRYMPNQMTLFPMETEPYDSWLMRELLNNCIAHTNYQLGGRIYANEFEDKLKFTNPGDFIPQKIENVLEASYSPPFYRNQLLAESMAEFHMIDTATLGIRRAYNIQKAKYFPMPDYNVSSGMQVEVTIYGKALNDSYMHILYDHQDLDLQTVFLLDRIQKGLPVEKEDVDRLRAQKLVEGRLTSLYLSASADKSIDESTIYIKNKGFNEENCDAPPKENAVAGRANSTGVSFLYAASDKKTVIMEMRPQIGQYFNVCKIEICRNILIFDFTYTVNEMKEDESTKSGDLYAKSKEFWYPNYGNPEDYIPTQYFCEYLKQKDLDGIRHKSVVSPEGTNLIIFDTNSADKPYKILESRVFEVENIDIKFEQNLRIEE